MISNTPYNQLRQLLMERLGYKNVTELYERYEIGEPYEEHTLQDVLLALNQMPYNFSEIISIYGGLGFRKGEFGELSYYDLTKPLANQSDETLLALIELIK